MTPPAKSEPAVPTGNVYERLARAYRAVASAKFDKSKKVGGYSASYSYIPIDQILAIVRKAQADAGLVVVFGAPQYDPAQGERRWEEAKQSKDGAVTKWTYAVGHIDVRIFGASSDDCIEMTVPFEASDNSDKLTNKIITNAERILYRTLYTIDEGGPEDDPGEDPENINVERTVSKPVKATEVTSDREPEVMADTVRKAYADGVCKATIGSMMQTHGDDPLKWPSTTLKQTYRAVVTKRRTMEAGA